MSLRRLAPTALAAVALLALAGPTGSVATAAVPTSPGPAVTVSGSGWGHSVGMSQYGAREMARRGFTATQVLQHYYPGTLVASHPQAADDVVVRTNVFLNRPQAGAETVRLVGQGGGAALFVGGGEAELDRELRVRHDVGRRVLVVTDAAGAPVLEGPDTAPVRAVPRAGGQVRLLDLAEGIGVFAHGEVEVAARSAESPALEPVVVQPMSRYLRGIGEVPSSWEPAALQAQAIAARTYAARIVAGRVLAPGEWHLGATPANQNYVGWAKESEPTYGVRWVEAVAATAGRAVTYSGALATTYYSSSHGLGRSENSEDSWAYGASMPYLRSVDDPYSAGGGNPYNAWTARTSNVDLAALVGLVRISNVSVASRTAGGSPKVLRLRGWLPDGRLIECSWSGAAPCEANDTSGKGAGARMRTGLTLTEGGAGGRLRSQQVSGFRVEPFSDDEGSVHQFNIGAVAAAGITTGCGEALYCPGAVVTRGQMASFLGRATGIAPDENGAAFSDVAGSTHRGYINALARAGEVGGYPDGTYRPDQPVSRAQMASFLVNAFDLPASDRDAFTDDDGTTHEAKINAVAARGITSGCGGTSYCPGTSVTREQMASFLARSKGIGD